jgi:hypothetical protein
VDAGTSAADLYDLDHYRNLEWQINVLLPENEDIVGVEVLFDNIYDNGICYWPYDAIYYHNDLYVGMMDRNDYNQGQDDLIIHSVDHQDGTDEFAGIASYVNLEHYHDIVMGPANVADVRYVFDASEVQILKSYLADGAFSLTFDPDCHFTNDGVFFRIETQAQDIPEPSVVLMLGAGLLVLAFHVRKKRG